MNNLYNQLTKLALPPANIFQRGLEKVKDTANLFRSTKGGKNKLYNTFAEQGDEYAKGVVSSDRKKFGKNLALGAAGVGAVGYGGYALGQKKQASYYELGHMLLEKDAGPKIDNVKKSLSSFWRNKIKHNYNSGKTYIKGKGDKWFGTAKDGKTRFDKGVSGVRKARPYVVGGAAGIGGTALYNKYKNRDQE